MSSDGVGAVAGERDRAQGLVPKLRFPEFKHVGEWAEKPLASIAQINPSNGALPSSFAYIDLGVVEDGRLTAVNMIARDGAPSRAQRVLKGGDILFQMVRPYQRNNLFFDLDDGDFVASTGYAQLRSKGPTQFLYQIIHADYFVDRVIGKCTGSNYPAINSSDLAAIQVLVPDEPEQQKLAECLSSLDAVIAAERERLAALRDHKKGLMQALFPAPGQTIPRLRFPEFQDAEDWEEQTLGDVCEMKAGRFVAAAEISETESDGTYPCYGGNGLRGFTKTYTHSGTYPLIGRQGALCGNVNLVTDRFHATEHAIVVASKSKIPVEWLYRALVRMDLNRFATGQAQPGVSVDVLERLSCWVPSSANEAERIAECLDSIDCAIAAHSARMDELKAHKSGLMQQLFPSPAEASA